MPASFFQGDTLETLVTYLSSLGQEQSARQRKAFEAARAAYPGVDHELGKRIFLSQNCLACHEHHSLEPWKKHPAPDLSREGSRVKKKWLNTYLESPHPIRPFGFYPGSGSRMPGFSLTEKESEVLAEHLSRKWGDALEAPSGVTDKLLSSYERYKAGRLVEERLSCLGCHHLGDKGGRIGPSLSGLVSRLRPGFVYRMIVDPHGQVPETVMPVISMPEEDAQLVTRYLLENETAPARHNYLSLADYPLDLPASGHDGEDIFGLYCAGCHGIRGEGNGFNRDFLSVKPAALSDSLFMSQRPDDTLFDGIYSGGHILGKSPLMPPFGHTLTRREIREVVSYLRELCGCEGPEWSR